MSATLAFFNTPSLSEVLLFMAIGAVVGLAMRGYALRFVQRWTGVVEHRHVHRLEHAPPQPDSANSIEVVSTGERRPVGDGRVSCRPMKALPLVEDDRWR
jgi:hypothetical protein